MKFAWNLLRNVLSNRKKVSVVQVMAEGWLGAKPLPVPMMTMHHHPYVSRPELLSPVAPFTNMD